MSEDTETELKPCPFCGSDARAPKAYLPENADCTDLHVRCDNCDAIGPSILVDHELHTPADFPRLEQEVVDLWNDRFPSQPIQEERGGWQPIETAPRDGTEIIGYRPDQGVFVFRWAWMEEFVPKDQHGDPTEEYDEDFAWWWHDRWDWMEDELTPTHWMPLPSAPNPSRETT